MKTRLKKCLRICYSGGDMKLFKSNGPRDVIFLEPVKMAGEKLPRGKVRMLYCDAEGKVYTTLIDRTVYKLALDSAGKMESSSKDYATLGLEIGPGNFLPLVVEISRGEVWTLEHILGHARRSGSIPDVLRKQLRQIIKLGESGRKGVPKESKEKSLENTSAGAPEVLNRLPYYLEGDIKFSMPVYKARHSFPLLVIKCLEPGGSSHAGEQRLLVLDNDGDLAVIKVPLKMVAQAEKRLEEWTEESGTQACIVIAMKANGFDTNFLTISQPQRNALDAIAQCFAETGKGQQPVPAAARRVLVRARDMSVTLPE